MQVVNHMLCHCPINLGKIIHLLAKQVAIYAVNELSAVRPFQAFVKCRGPLVQEMFLQRELCDVLVSTLRRDVNKIAQWEVLNDESGRGLVEDLRPVQRPLWAWALTLVVFPVSFLASMIAISHCPRHESTNLGVVPTLFTTPQKCL